MPKTCSICFDFVESTKFDENPVHIVAKNGNNVEATFDFVEKTIFYNKLVRHCGHF